MAYYLDCFIRVINLHVIKEQAGSSIIIINDFTDTKNRITYIRLIGQRALKAEATSANSLRGTGELAK